MTKRSYRLIHLTDFHLLAEPTGRLHGWAVASAFERVLAHVQHHVDAIDGYLLGGDLVDDESPAGYRALDHRLARLERPVLAMAGNHDDPGAMRRCLDHACCHDTQRYGNWRVIALNSHRDDSEAGRLGADQIAALDRRLAAEQGPVLIALHHPPVATGSDWIDAIGLDDHEALAAVVARHAPVRGVLCGHAHQAARLRFADRPCWITPATMRQFLPGAADFAEDERRAPGYRIVDLCADGQIDTRVVRVPDARRAGPR